MIDFSTIKNELDNFENESIDIIDDLKFNQRENIKKIVYYYNSEFIKGKYDDQGDRKAFFNVSKVSCDVCEKAIDFDVKDITLRTAQKGAEVKTWFLEKDFKHWAKENQFGKKLNRIFHELPIYGSVVLKKVKGDYYFVDLKNFAVQQDADTLTDASYIIEVHTYNPLQFKRIAKENNWEDWEKALEEKTQITVYERYGEDDDLNYRRTIIAKGESGSEGVIMVDDIVEEHPYWEFHLNKLSGRWQGVGMVEMSFEPQVRINQLINQRVKSSYWNALRLWQCKDPGVKRNLLEDVKNGEILQVNDPISQVDMVDRNVVASENELNRWVNNKNEITFSYDVMRGEALPSRTPLGTTQLLASQATSYFGQIQENIALDVKEWVFDILEGFRISNSKEHNLKIIGSDLEEYNLMLINTRVKNELLGYIFKKLRIPTKEEFELLKAMVAENIKKGKEKIETLPSDFFKDLKYEIDIMITGESFDSSVDNANRIALIQLMSSDPALFNDPRKRKVLAPILERMGISPVELDGGEQQNLQEMVQRGGGGVSKPVMPAYPTPGETRTNL
ncbi:MAG: hypothetical protein WC302_03580 [Candidatus Paceibacterota bacterium]|jgi:hypothetical protein